MDKKNTLSFIVFTLAYFSAAALATKDTTPTSPKAMGATLNKKNCRPHQSAPPQKKLCKLAPTKSETGYKKASLPTPTEQKEVVNTSRTITVKNNISPEMTKYRFWGTYYSPTNFYLTVDSKSIKTGEKTKCAVSKKNKIDVTYHYEFKSGMVTGSKCIELEVPENESAISLTFSWDKNHRLISSSGRTVKAKKGVLNSTCDLV